ncbi:VIT1/CCC1 family predicted Fe2+/Mn2+ transporter [Arcanobacterium wilhelmae]|uniref:VIT1/CCC1 family predicted Fe2+/Mn2+ transporter n=1 Tax=Arcanobacterium wilhelmae TaxID=1803177 RepID=A0ABT9NDY5_9ACTO|nr:VIT family protein [Arcanobacterium wilhelmae]MDP9801735.1 VIT1/CCC1 family predicted Fe2+/Mn2+ transporter [Arcanobacterium wilhelmae]WFN91051.1 VIT family protein [Arcanobacterium wilhelmae]
MAVIDTPAQAFTDAPLNTDFPVIEPTSIGGKLNWLRAGVLGANDGIVSIAGLVTGVAGASLTGHALLAAGIAGVGAGALSMAAGEYVSVSTQRDSERAAIARQRVFIDSDPQGAERKLAGMIAGRGISKPVAAKIARELSVRDPYEAHAHYEYGLDADELTNPWHAALASMLAFVLGSIIPMAAILLSPVSVAVIVTVIAVSIALAITGGVSASLGNAPIVPAVIRNILWGNAAMWVTYGVGYLLGAPTA